MSERGNRDGSLRRSSYRKSLSETSLPPQYLAQLEEKRKQLDESIHKYIAAKEREYKLFEKDLRQQHKAGQNGDTANGTTSKRRSSLESPQGGSHDAVPDPQRPSAVDALLGSSARREPEGRIGERDEEVLGLRDRSTIAGLKDRRASLEREKDFVGVFTPAFLPAIEDRDSPKLERTSSAPSAVQSSSIADTQHADGSLGRAFSDSAMQAQPKRPPHLALVQRTSSSGSSADGKLASAMKRSQPPKRKRVSLAVGDAIVAPSDNVPLSLSHHSSSSHSRIRASVTERDLPISTQELAATSAELASFGEPPLLINDNIAAAGAIRVEKEESSNMAPAIIPPPPSSPPNRANSLKSGSSTTKLDPDGDLFGLEEEEFGEDRPAGDAIFLQDDPDEVEEGTVASEDEVASNSRDLDPDGVRYDPTTGFIPEPADGADSAVPYLAFGPGSSVASQQPTQPGFRRPSVIDDPIYRGTNYRAAERDAVDNEIYGSSFIRPSSKGSFAAGSLGESYMAKHAEEMMKARISKQEAQVRS